jgi:L-malate glycosyltransferase
MRILVASHTYIVDLNCEKLRTLAQLNPAIELLSLFPDVGNREAYKIKLSKLNPK